MHSKVILASLVCALAASFGAGSKMASGFKKVNQRAAEMVCHAPNDEQNHFEFVEDCVHTESPFFITFVSEKTAFTSVTVVRQTGVMLSGGSSSGNRISFSLIVGGGVEDRIIVVRFRNKKGGGAITCQRNLYVHSKDGYSCISALSISDARAKYFMNCIATPEERESLANGSPTFTGSSSGNGFSGDPYNPGHPDPLPPFPPIPDPNPPKVGKMNSLIGHSDLDFPLISFDPFTPTVEEEYVDYVFGDSQDMTFTVDLVSKEGLPQYAQRTGTGLNAQVNWYDEYNIMHPAKGISVQFYTNGEVLHDYGHIFSQKPMSYDYRTGQTGYCNVDVISDVKLSSLQARICADSSSTRVEDNFKIDYPFFARASAEILSLPISEYAEITFTINIRQRKSERGEAFAISQKQNIPYDYCEQFTDGVNAVKTIYPSENTYYDANYDTIMIQKEDHNSWDVLNHEYGHYISDKLNLCNLYGSRKPHNIYDDLTIEYGETAGKELAYSEGLATYLGIASQIYNSGEFRASDYADEVYHDEFRSVEADYDEYFLEIDDDKKAENIEACVTGAMLKLLDDVNRDFDDVALGHAAMWNAIKSAGKCNIAGDLFSKISEQNQEFFTEINQLLNRERFAEIPSQPVEPPVEEPEDDWTILFYSCATCQATFSRDIVLPPVPDNINFVCQGGSGGTMTRTYTSDGVDHPDITITDTAVGNGEAFEDFITWGLREFPAKKTAVIITNHGQGLNGCCIDSDYTDDTLLNSETKLAFEHAFAANNITKKLEFICYSACLMQVQDIAMFNAPFFKYQIASEEEMIDSLIPNRWIIDLFDNKDTLDILESMVDCFIDFENDGYRPNAAQCISVLDLSYMEEYKNAFEELASKIPTVDNYEEWFHRAVYSSRHFGNGAWLGGMGPVAFGLIDAYDLLDELTHLRDVNGDIIEDFESPFLGLTNDAGEPLLDKVRVLIHQVVLMERSYGGMTGADISVYERAYGISAHIYYESGEGTFYPVEETSFYNWRHLFVSDN